ncbi:triacylglycerol lipase OBL1-like [Nymphaea colorata]|nr:triacylglycerol lipase OBL1-like [Nymphaea colorata]
MATKAKARIGYNGNHLLLRPKGGGAWDLVHLLFSKNVNKNNFMVCPEGTMLAIAQRWILIVSILAQKFLMLVKSPLSSAGEALEFALNLFSENGGLLGLIWNRLRGNTVIPDKESPNFRTMLGHMDSRTDLGDHYYKGSGDSMSQASLSIMAAKIAYENAAFIRNVVSEQWKMEFVEFLNCWNEDQQQASTQAFIFRDGNLISVVFRGTEPFNAYDWCTDVSVSWYEIPPMGKVHQGFLTALGVEPHGDSFRPITSSQKVGYPLAYYAIRDRLKQLLSDNGDAKFIVTGHSLGGALAILFPAVLVLFKEQELVDKLAGVYTFGQPRVGDEKFGDYMQKVLLKHGAPPRYYRFVYCNDMVPRVPYDDRTLQFKHFGACVYYSSTYRPKMMNEEPNKNYFSLMYVVPKLVNAIWEILRGIFIGLVVGKEYEEGWFQLLFRCVGLVIPGLPDHGPRDYINSTRLSAAKLDKSKQS